METLGPAPQQAEEFSQLDEEEGEEEGDQRAADQPRQKQLLGLLLFHNGEDFIGSGKLARSVILKMLSSLLEFMKTSTTS